MTLNQVDEDEEEADHQDTDIKPLGETFAHHQRLFPQLSLINFFHYQLFSGRRCPCHSDVRASVLRVEANSVALPNRVRG